MKTIYKIIFIALFFLMLLFQRMEVSFLMYYEIFLGVISLIIFITTSAKLYKEDKENGTSKLKEKLIHMLIMAIILIAFYFIIIENMKIEV